MPTAEHTLELEILPQPTDTTCGPTCLHAVYAYYGDHVDLGTVIEETRELEEGGTLAVHLGSHALKRGYEARIITYNLQLFDPTWLTGEGVDLTAKLALQRKVKRDRKLREASDAYLEFLELGGQVRFEDLAPRMLRGMLQRGPVLTGLSATYLYASRREYGPECVPDDVRGSPVGHFVVLSGYRAGERTVRVADPWHRNPVAEGRYYWVEMPRLIGAILLGVVTYDANLLILQPRRKRSPWTR